MFYTEINEKSNLSCCTAESFHIKNHLWWIFSRMFIVYRPKLKAYHPGWWISSCDENWHFFYSFLNFRFHIIKVFPFPQQTTQIMSHLSVFRHKLTPNSPRRLTISSIIFFRNWNATGGWERYEVKWKWLIKKVFLNKFSIFHPHKCE